VLLKLWNDIGRREQRHHLVELQQDPDRSWQAGPTEWQRHAQHAIIEAIGKTLRDDTQAPHAPWQRLPFRDPGEQLSRVGRALLDVMEAPPEPPATTLAALPDELPGVPSLRRADAAVDERLDKAAYLEHLARGQARLANNAREIARRRIPVVIAFEGHDA
ncbi:MAG: hypothetical protein ABR580_12285, partial [Halomonas sp.]